MRESADAATDAGGDISRKKKLLNAQIEGKKRMKTMGKVDVPQSAFMSILKLGKSSGDKGEE